MATTLSLLATLQHEVQQQRALIQIQIRQIAQQQATLDVQFKRIADIQAELDLVKATVRLAAPEYAAKLMGLPMKMANAQIPAAL